VVVIMAEAAAVAKAVVGRAGVVPVVVAWVVGVLEVADRAVAAKVEAGWAEVAPAAAVMVVA
jgi:hypothetical protein